MKRQRGRNRSGGGGSGGGGGGGKQGHNVNRAFDSNGPDNVKIRGHAQHVYEKYQQLARDASSSGDRVLAENYLQHAEHYYRVLRTLQPQRPASDFVSRDSAFDLDFDDEGNEGGATDETTDAPVEGGENGEARRDERSDRGDRQDRGERQERGEWRRDDREGRDNREGRDRDNRDRGERQERGERAERGERGEGRRDRFEGRREDRAPREGRNFGARSEEREAAPAAEVVEAPVATEETSTVLRSQDGGVSHAPAFLQAPAAAEEGERRPRRPRRRPRSFEPGEGGDAAPAGESDEG